MLFRELMADSTCLLYCNFSHLYFIPSPSSGIHRITVLTGSPVPTSALSLQPPSPFLNTVSHRSNLEVIRHYYGMLSEQNIGHCDILTTAGSTASDKRGQE